MRNDALCLKHRKPDVAGHDRTMRDSGEQHRSWTPSCAHPLNLPLGSITLFAVICLGPAASSTLLAVSASLCSWSLGCSTSTWCQGRGDNAELYAAGVRQASILHRLRLSKLHAPDSTQGALACSSCCCQETDLMQPLQLCLLVLCSGPSWEHRPKVRPRPPLAPPPCLLFVFWEACCGEL